MRSRNFATVYISFLMLAFSQDLWGQSELAKQALEFAEEAKKTALENARTALQSAAETATLPQAQKTLFDGISATEYPQEPLHHNPWSLIIYRPENNWDFNDVRCWVKIQDAETGEDVTYKKIKASYEWVSMTRILPKNPMAFEDLFIPDTNAVLYSYRRTYYLSGGMAMHLNLPMGKYKISVYTPQDKTNGFETENESQWNSNIFFYDTSNPAKVIFVVPTANDNGFYNGGWYIDYKAPDWFKFTVPKMK